MVDINFLKKNIDFTNVKPNVSVGEINNFCRRAIFHQVQTIYVPPIFVAHTISQVKQSGITVGTTAGFPYGNIPLKLKIGGVLYAAHQGAKWVDVCLNVSLIKSGQNRSVENEVEQLKVFADKNNVGLKIIVESPYLSDDELVFISRIIEKHRIDYLKTASGVGNKVTERDVKIIKPLLKYSKLKVAGGISTLDQANKFFELGADKIGSSKGFEILDEAIGVTSN